ncbi:MAG: bifunctional glutamate N-acetyltransferase/amino-acid acetyltransferase ArgJ [Deltaproteobacteria bacterium]|nr:bifunctional glutamate N-acetyltransferase/amino-acid acetyltransferase ArgJ [Deltaproteobacteria bacterium]
MTDKFTCSGFKAAGIAAGIKKDGKKDLGLIFSETPAIVAGVFTQNRVKAAPVLLDMERISLGRCQAIIANSGNANCCTGQKGMHAADAMARSTASGLDIPQELVMVASTGVIGTPLPIDKIEAAIPALVESLRADGFSEFAESIMTTDTVPKIVSETGAIDEEAYTVTGVVKGAGMIRPDMATMLCFVATDIRASRQTLQDILSRAVSRSFNRITVDGDTSTNDTVLLLANGMSKAEVKTAADKEYFQEVMDSVLGKLARMLISDAEGATKLVEVSVKGALSENHAETIAFTVAHSPLVKTALFAEDANWGRIMAAVGRSGVPVNQDRIDVYFDDVMLVKNGVRCGDDAEAKATKVLRQPEYTMRIDLNMGTDEFSVLTCDFSIDYIRVNADYRS